MKRNRCKIVKGLIGITLVVFLAGCGGAYKTSSDTVASGESYNNYIAQKEEMYYDAEMYYEAEMDGGLGSETGMMDDAKAEGVNESAATTQRKLIKTVNMDVETQEFDALMSSVQSQVKKLGGYIENMDTYNGSMYYSYQSGIRNANMTIRIPKENLDAFLNTISDISNVIRRSDSEEDVTLTYVDLESHKIALETEYTRLLELLEKAETIDDIITIENRLSNLRYQMESMESQLRTYDNKVDYSTIYLNIDEVEVLTPVEEETPGERISTGFKDSLKDIKEGFVEFGIWFIINIPYLIIWAIVITVIVVVIKLIKKHSKKKKEKRAQKQMQQAQPQQAQETQVQTQLVQEKHVQAQTEENNERKSDI